MIVIIAAGLAAMADQSAFTTSNVFNGHMWRLMSATQKTSHLNGIQEGIRLCMDQIKHDLHIPPELMTELNFASSEELQSNLSNLRHKYK